MSSGGHSPHDTASANRVFISCVSDEFETTEPPKPDPCFPGLRGDLRRYLSRADCEVKVQEDFRQEGKADTIEKLDRYIRGCAAVVHLVGENPGAIANAEAVRAYLASEPEFLSGKPELRSALGDFSGISYTQWEAYLALQHGIPLFVYQTDKATAEQRAHLDRLRGARRYGEVFADQAALFGKLLGDLREIIAAIPARPDLAPSRILRHAPRELFGRDEWLDELDAVWDSRTSVNVYSLIAWGGSGKTSLVAHWVNRRLARRGWPGVERYFDWSFYSQGTREQSQASADFFIAAALEFFGDPDPTQGSAWDRGQRLAKLVRQHRTLLVLDGIEPLQYPPNSQMAGEFKDQAIESLLNALAQDNPGLCLVTSREPLKNLETFGGIGAEEKQLNHLTKEAAIGLLRHLAIAGTEAEMEEAWRDAGGHALTLQLLGRFLADAHGGDIRRRKEVKFEVADRETPGRTAMKVMLAYEKWLESAGPDRQRDLAVLRLMGLFDRPADAGCLAALRAEPAIPGLTEEISALADWEWNMAIKDLEALDLVTVNREGDPEQPTSGAAILSLDAHPLVREYFAKQLRETQPEAFRAAHSRLFDHLCESAPHQPDGIEGLQPLYQAVSHGCLAGRHEEARADVYRDRILRGTGSDGFYSTKRLGAIGADLGAVAAFFDEPWRRLSPNLSEADQAWLLNAAAYRLRALGRLTEAVEPMRVGMEGYSKSKDWRNAAITASNLSELEVTLGLLDAAVVDGQRAVEFADQSGDWEEKIVNRTTAADARHQHGERETARALFAEAERMQAERQPEYPLLYSLGGFRYCDLILAPAERAAWHTLGGRRSVGALTIEDEGPNQDEISKTSFVADRSPEEASAPTMGAERASAAEGGAKRPKRRPPSTPEALEACAEAKRRASQTLEWVTGKLGLLTIALDHLTLARAELYAAILSAPASASASTADAPEDRKTENVILKTQSALHALREANSLNLLPQALLTAALCEGVFGDKDQAEAYLREAQQIAERGPMPLHLADVHLHRARLFRDREELAKARALIEKHEYWRRREELADAEAASTDWP